MDYFRKPEVTVTLPAGSWYNEGIIDFDTMGDVSVYSMLPADEIMLINPDALVSGVALVETIKSCVPAVKDPNKLYYPDVNALLLAIQKATYGQKISQSSFCPKCMEKKNEILIKRIEEILKEKGKVVGDLSEQEAAELREQADKDIAPEITNLEKEDKIFLQPVETIYTYDELVGLTTLLPEEKFVEIGNLKVYCSPFKLSDKIKFANLEIKKNQILKAYKNTHEPDQFIEESFVNRVEDIMGEYKLLSKMSIDIIKNCILKVVTPDGKEVSSREYINEFVEQLDVSSLYKIRDAIRELNAMGVPQTLQYECPCCGHQWEDKFDGYNQADFFGEGS